ncbi:MAG: high-potential iron-sulfur protein [Rhodoferax sp.]|uniref:high-potential iron-sulfur protein n=1 Tax=Rhodoferax sp. TaxID=50421 RepID=UPI00260CD662|nr:high-potential iron-sulfur protein [Rhodoferax sp.]MDD5336635.1 high-potential iron-sulfur protein [Rhodoferax sp.]
MNITTTRRRFIAIVPTAGAALFTVGSAGMQSAYAATAPVTGVAALVGEKDVQAVALGYVDDAIRVDKAKFKAYVAGSQCSGCALYLGKAGDSAGGCPVFQGKNVTAKGWCSAWAKKA